MLPELVSSACFHRGSPADQPPRPLDPPPRPSAETLRAFGALVRARREQAGFSVGRVAKLARSSSQTLTGIEAGRIWPSRHTLIRLLSLRELRLTWAELAPLNRGDESGERGAAPTPVQAPVCSRLCCALSSPRPGFLALYRWLPQVWEPGRESLERQRLEAFLRTEGWALVSEEVIGDPVAGTFYLFRRC